MKATGMPVVMGILNVTPDSFSDGGRWADTGQALDHALAMAGAGAGIIDVGGESTRPGAKAVSDQEEMDRVLPVIEALAARTPASISVDTSRAAVMREAVRVGASMINDVRALREPGALETAAELDAQVCLMHMQGEPRSMQADPRYDDVVGEVESFLVKRAAACRSAGIAGERIVIDPGFGFGKSFEHNLELFGALPRLAGLGYRLLVGVSRKSMLGTMTGRDVESRMAASVAAALRAAEFGADILRVHDVAETVDALRVFSVLGADC